MLLKYRTDIDGLRAIAVLAVLFYHTEIPGFVGGFVGVDIFFVISGFLITSIIVKEINSGKFSITLFYERRVRRIFPALFPVMLFSLIIGTYLFEHRAFKDLGQSIAATALFSSNILFLRESDYFAASSLQKPLLHTWSLAVEEQFYIIFPLVLVIINRFQKNRYFVWINIILILSFASSVYGVYNYPEATFFLVYTRAWELMVGAVFAIGVLSTPSTSMVRNSLSVTGIILIIYSIACTEATLFPGYKAIAPVLGSGLIIYTGGTGFVNKLLSFRPLVFIGKISYSLYLWHWPLIAFSKYLMFRPFNWLESLVIILASLSLAVLSWKFIEQPFRGKQGILPERKKLFSYSGAVIVVAAGIGVLIHLYDGYPFRHSPEIKKIHDCIYWDDWYPVGLYGIIEQKSNIVIPGRIGEKNNKPTFLLWGDSHAMNLVPGLDISSKKYKLSGFIATHSSCPPILDVDNKSMPFNEIEFNQNVFNFIKNNKEVKYVILACAWSNYTDNYLYRGRYNKELTTQRDGALLKTISKILSLNKKVILITDIPSIKIDDPFRLYYLQQRFPYFYSINEYSNYTYTIEEYNKINSNFDDILSRLHGNSGVSIIETKKIFFKNNSGYSIYSMNGIPMYRNNNHLSSFGSKVVATMFDDIFSQISL